MQMFSAILRAQEKEGGKKLYHIAIMPCTAKKMEAAREEFKHGDQPMLTSFSPRRSSPHDQGSRYPLQ